MPVEQVMYRRGEVRRVWEELVEVVFPSAWTTSLNSVIFWAALSLVAMYV